MPTLEVKLPEFSSEFSSLLFFLGNTATRSPDPSMVSLQKDTAEPVAPSPEHLQQPDIENGKSTIEIGEKQTEPRSPAEPAKPPPKGSPPVYSAFSPGRKRFILGVTTIAGFFGPFAGNIYLPALPVLQKEFGVSVTAINASVTVFMAVFAVGVSLLQPLFYLFQVLEDLLIHSQPLLWASHSDWKGRRPLYIISLAIYIISNILLAAVPSNYAALMILRVVQAFGSSAVVSMGAGTVADVSSKY
jgi:hypothetical protein